ncbi:MAG: VacJ family lipoprotein [Alphaproteobacteria bacterium]|nr:VacJ family lipoprotein [Alphaproteobacteria bacterium]
MKKNGLIFLTCASLFVMGCAIKPTDPIALQAYEEANDPLEPFNRAMFETNMLLDTAILKPVAKGYRAITPVFVRQGVSNFFDNLKQPGYFVNSLLQGEGQTAFDISRRFLANTLLGLGGLFDVASDMNIPVHTNDFGETLAVWGWEKSEPYIVWPLLGPSNPRDTIGAGFNMALSTAELSVIDEPMVRYGIWALDTVQTREKSIEFIESLEKGTTDLYATVRSMYRQNREKKINKATGTLENQGVSAYDFDFDDEE